MLIVDLNMFELIISKMAGDRDRLSYNGARI